MRVKVTKRVKVTNAVVFSKEESATMLRHIGCDGKIIDITADYSTPFCRAKCIKCNFEREISILDQVLWNQYFYGVNITIVDTSKLEPVDRLYLHDDGVSAYHMTKPLEGKDLLVYYGFDGDYEPLPEEDMASSFSSF